MAGGNTVLARIGLDDRGFQEGVSKIQRSLKVVQSEFAAASMKLSDFGSSTDGLKLKSDSLSRQIDLQKEKVKALAKGYEESIESKGADAKATENLKIKLNYANAELSKMKNELGQVTSELKLKSSAWYGLSTSLGQASQKLGEIGTKMSSVGKSMTASISLPILGVGTAATKMAMDAVESENLFEVSMGSMAGAARSWSEDLSNSLGMNEYGVRQNVATFNAMITSMGLTADESLGMSEGLTKLSYDMASFYNLKPEEAFEKLKSGIAGEAEPLKALGILVNDNTIKTYAYSHGIAKQGAALTESQKVQARYGAILQATEKAQGDLGRTMDSPTNKLRILKEQAAELAISFGQALIPILEKLIAFVKPIVEWFSNLSKGQQALIVKVALFAAAIGPMLMVVGKIISVVSTLAGIFSAISGAVAAAGGALAILTGPIGIAVLVIGGLIAAGVALFKNWDKVKEMAKTVWEVISSTVSSAVNFIKDIISLVFSGITAYFKVTFAIYGAIFKTAFDVIKTVATAAFTGIKKVIIDPIKEAADFIKDMVDKIKGFFSGLKISLPKIKLPHFSLEGEFSLLPPKVPKLSIDWYAQGGIFQRPSIIGVGEAGAEAVLPISKLDALMANAMGKTNGNGEVAMLLERILSVLQEAEGGRVVLDTGAVVGELVYPMNKALGKIKERR
jgi:phage-related minor tail protein